MAIIIVDGIIMAIMGAVGITAMAMVVIRPIIGPFTIIRLPVIGPFTMLRHPRLGFGSDSADLKQSLSPGTALTSLVLSLGPLIVNPQQVLPLVIVAPES